MELKTKYNVGDKLVGYDVSKGRLVEFEVKWIGITIDADLVNVKYYKDYETYFPQHVCALSRQEFIDGL